MSQLIMIYLFEVCISFLIVTYFLTFRIIINNGLFHI